MPKILIIEDNKTTAAYLEQGLREHCFLTYVAYNGQDGLYMAENDVYDLITLDVMLPGMDGQFCKTFGSRCRVFPSCF